MKFKTKVIHGGQQAEKVTGAVIPPIFQTSTYKQSSPGKHSGYEYARTQNPTRDALQAALANIENGKYGIAFASGLAATDAIIKLCKQGDKVIVHNDCYGGTYRIFTALFEQLGISFEFLDLTKKSSLKKIDNSTKLIWAETPTNPMMNILDIKQLIQHKKKALVAIDNTFASPALQNPLDLGADMVIHSATKFLGGHSDAVLGAVVCKDKKLADKLYYIQNASGAVPGPMDCFLIHRGIKTLALRMKQHCKNGEKVARFLRSHPKVNQVNWPGFKDHKGYKIATEQMKDYGGMLSFTTKSDTKKDAYTVLENLHYFTLAESLGGVESLCGHPASMTHASIPIEERKKTGVTDSLIRLSVGIEDADDLINDLKHALSKI